MSVFDKDIGLVAPLSRRGGTDFKSASDVDLIESNIKTILMTRSEGRIHGELPWRPDFGSQIPVLRHRHNDEATSEIAKEFALRAIEQWEPRAHVTDLSVLTRHGEERTSMILDIKFRIRNIVNSQDGERTVRVEL